MIPKIVKKILWSEKWVRLVIPLKFSVAKLKRAADKCNSIEKHVDLALNTYTTFPFLCTSIPPMQVKEEIIELLKILARHKPKHILEIGTEKGGTMYLLTRVSSPDATIISIDLPGGRFGGGYPEWRIPLYKSFAVHNQKIHLIRADSHAFSTLKMVEKILEGRKLDFLFIDGDHSYEGVKTDFEMYSKLVRKNGIIAFHDVVPGPQERVGGVPRFWDEIKDNLRYVELVKNWKQGGYGIGIIYV